MNYEIKNLKDEKGNPQTDQFGNIVLTAIENDVDGNFISQVGVIVYPPKVIGAEDFATRKLKIIIESHQKNKETSSQQTAEDFLNSFQAEMEVEKTNNGQGQIK